MKQHKGQGRKLTSSAGTPAQGFILTGATSPEQPPPGLACPGIQGPAGHSPSLYVHVEAGSWRLLLMHWQRFGLGQRWFVAHGVCQGRVVLPVAQVCEHQAHH